MKLSSSDMVAALDVGDVRIGVAATRVAVALPQPYSVIANDLQVWDNIMRFIKENDIAALVVGLPRGLDGQETAQTEKVRRFATELESKVGIPIHLQDEAATSVKAEAELQTAGKRYNKGMVDSLAAVYILEDFLRDQRVEA